MQTGRWRASAGLLAVGALLALPGAAGAESRGGERGDGKPDHAGKPGHGGGKPGHGWGRGHAPQAPRDLTVGDRERPLAVEPRDLQFGWLPQDRDGDERQKAYQLRVWSEGRQRPVWDSGVVRSSEQQYVGYAGPRLDSGASYRWSVRTWDATGRVSRWAPSARFDTALADADWQASWIWRSSTEADDYTLARKEVTIGSSSVVRARLYASAYHQYRVELNGREVDDGPAFSYPGEGYYQATDVTKDVRAGKPLAIGITAHWYGGGQGRPRADRRLLAQLVVDHADGTRETIGTDGSWRVRRASQWETGTPRRNGDAGDWTERIDARQEPLGWSSPGYDDSAEPWADATVLGRHPQEAGDYARLTGQETRLRKTVVGPVSVRTLPDGAIVADFGRVIPARPVIRFQQGEAGRAVEIQTSYRLTADGHADPAREATQGSNLSARYVQRGGEETFTPFLHWGWRYLEIRAPGAGEPIDAGDLAAIVEHTDAPLDGEATFASSDQTLNDVWALMQHSSINSIQHQFVDTPTREKGQFLGDAVDISYATMSGWAERDATQQAIREFMGSQARCWSEGEQPGRLNAVYPNGDGCRDIPDYTEMFVDWVWRYWEQTGDRSLLADAYPVIRNVADYVARHRDAGTGLVHDLTGGSGPYRYGIVDWPEQGRYGYDMDTVARTTINAQGVEVFRRVADAGEVLGVDAAEVDRYRAQETGLRDAINARLRRADGIYVDGLKADGTQSAGVSQHANSYAIGYGVAPREDWDAIADHLASTPLRMGPMTAHWLLQAFIDAGRPQDALVRLTDREGDGWANVIARGGTFTWEAWNLVGSESESHGWGAQAAVDVLEGQLGIRVAAPGASHLAIVPPAQGLEWARGSQRTQRGRVGVAWERTGGTDRGGGGREPGMRLAVDVPVNVTATVAVPVSKPGRPPHASGEGAPRFRGFEDGRALFEVGSGETRFQTR